MEDNLCNLLKSSLTLSIIGFDVSNAVLISKIFISLPPEYGVTCVSQTNEAS
jgi:hypothetical protein